MGNYSIRNYQQADYQKWNAFIATAKNATFLFHRDFMDYHADRFSDFSLMVYKGDDLIAVLPANTSGSIVISHQGLTYGGLVLGAATKLMEAIAIFRELLFHLHQLQKETVVLKVVPEIYHDLPSDEINYILFLAEGRLMRRDTLSVIDLQHPIGITSGRMEGVKKGIRQGLEIRETDDLKPFWNEILIPNLWDKHKAQPVHSLEEIQLLKTRFPKQIRQFDVWHQGKIVAGTTIFESNHVFHAQYISGNGQKNELGSVDFLYHHLLTAVFKDKKYFDFGISNEAQGRKLNSGLLFWKESFGARTIVHDFYEVATAHYDKLDTIAL